MKIILLEDVKKLGRKGDVVNVADGHARNFLIPRGLAVEASKGKMNELKMIKAKEAEIKKQEEQKARELAERLADIKVTIPVKVGEAGKLFGAVNNKDIADVLNKQYNLKLDKKKILLKEPIKHLGTYSVTAKLHPRVQARLEVEVVGE